MDGSTIFHEPTVVATPDEVTAALEKDYIPPDVEYECVSFHRINSAY